MRPFGYQRIATAEDAVRAIAAGGQNATAENPQFLGGGTNLTDYMRLNVLRPAELVDINGLEKDFGHIDAGPQGLRLGALVRMAQAAEHPEIRRDYPLISQSLLLAASPQIRNMASLGGNVLQRTRCQYFRDTAWHACNKRAPGTGCAALHGINRKHAVLGVSDHCIAAYAGDFAQALVALDATVELTSAGGPRILRFEDLHRVPGTTPHLETVLRPGELITGFAIPAGPWTRRSLYLKVRDRQSYEFAVASAAVALHLDKGVVREARIALGGVATKPWRAHDAEARLNGKMLDEAAAEDAAKVAFATSVTHGGNDFKPELGRRTLVRALLTAAQMEV